MFSEFGVFFFFWTLHSGTKSKFSSVYECRALQSQILKGMLNKFVALSWGEDFCVRDEKKFSKMSMHFKMLSKKCIEAALV